MHATIAFFLLAIPAAVQSDSVDELIKAGVIAMKQGMLEKALGALDKAVARDPRSADAVHLRGTVHFKLGHIAESIADFDKSIELEPKRKPHHWQRGISYYYAGRFDDGRRQFEGYQTVEANDVENVVWRYMCMARKDGVPKARAAMLKIDVGKDRRVPMKEIHELFLGQAKPADVLAAAKRKMPAAGKLKEQLFYAHLYIGLFYETEGDKAKALEHLSIAADNYAIGHYMWDVARVHRDLLQRMK